MKAKGHRNIFVSSILSLALFLFCAPEVSTVATLALLLICAPEVSTATTNENFLKALNIPKNLKYTDAHVWVRIEGKHATIGVTDFEQMELGDIMFVEPPDVGAKYNKGKAFGVVETTKAVIDIYAPLSGTIVKINEELEDAPELINKDPYVRGWICVIKLSSPAEADDLMDAKEYKKHVMKAPRN